MRQKEVHGLMAKHKGSVQQGQKGIYQGRTKNMISSDDHETRLTGMLLGHAVPRHCGTPMKLRRQKLIEPDGKVRTQKPTARKGNHQASV